MSTPHTDNERSRTIMDKDSRTPINKDVFFSRFRLVAFSSDADRHNEALRNARGLIEAHDQSHVVAELVEALEAMLDLYGPYADMLIHRKGGSRPVSEDKRVVQRAREALAKVRPETQSAEAPHA